MKVAFRRDEVTVGVGRVMAQREPRGLSAHPIYLTLKGDTCRSFADVLVEVTPTHRIESREATSRLDSCPLVPSRNALDTGTPNARPADLVDRIIDLQRITEDPNWDGEGADPIPRELWSRCFTEICRKTAFLPDPYIGPCADGTIHIEWTATDCRKFLIEYGVGILEWSITGADGHIEYSESRTVGEVLLKLEMYLR
ncbi:MAG: hypothetical protein JXP34_19920 [Planctomycetes bacterium]|nr:hypothetical protein [Planctomycetota bacterium]